VTIISDDGHKDKAAVDLLLVTIGCDCNPPELSNSFTFRVVTIYMI